MYKKIDNEDITYLRSIIPAGYDSYTGLREAVQKNFPK